MSKTAVFPQLKTNGLQQPPSKTMEWIMPKYPPDLDNVMIVLDVGKGRFQMPLRGFFKYRHTHLGSYVFTPMACPPSSTPNQKSGSTDETMSQTKESEAKAMIPGWCLKTPCAQVQWESHKYHWYYHIERSDVLFRYVIKYLSNPKLFLESRPPPLQYASTNPLSDCDDIKMEDILAEIDFYGLNQFLPKNLPLRFSSSESLDSGLGLIEQNIAQLGKNMIDLIQCCYRQEHQSVAKHYDTVEDHDHDCRTILSEEVDATSLDMLASLAVAELTDIRTNYSEPDHSIETTKPSK
ncbi:hypothetical protein RFI_14530, partial [Reticulomyxa filosa]